MVPEPAATPEVPVVVEVVTPAAVLGARRRDNGGWF